MEPHHFEEQGFSISGTILGPGECDALARRIDDLHSDTAGTRNLLGHAWCAGLARQLREHAAIAGLLPSSPVAVQCTLFEKSAGRNWLVPLHQDWSIPVKEKIRHAELSGWSEKEGCLYVIAPVAVLEQLVIVRIHIDDCGPEDGPLRIVPGSHRFGRLKNRDALAMRDRQEEQSCCVARGAALVMRPLLLHASSKASGQSRRRVLHFVFGPPILPFGLRWPDSVLNGQNLR